VLLKSVGSSHYVQKQRHIFGSFVFRPGWQKLSIPYRVLCFVRIYSVGDKSSLLFIQIYPSRSCLTFLSSKGNKILWMFVVSTKQFEFMRPSYVFLSGQELSFPKCEEYCDLGIIHDSMKGVLNARKTWQVSRLGRDCYFKLHDILYGH